MCTVRAEQKEKFLPQIAAGKLRAAIAFTEPGGGTDVLGALRTEAIRGDGGWILSGEKIWSSSAHVADYLLVLARTERNVKKRHQGVTLLWVPAQLARSQDYTAAEAGNARNGLLCRAF